MAHYKGASKEASRAMNLIKKRQKEQEELEMRKRKIEDELKIGTISNKFAAHYDAVETKLKSGTVGMCFVVLNSGQLFIVFSAFRLAMYIWFPVQCYMFISW